MIWPIFIYASVGHIWLILCCDRIHESDQVELTMSYHLLGISAMLRIRRWNPQQECYGDPICSVAWILAHLGSDMEAILVPDIKRMLQSDVEHDIRETRRRMTDNRDVHWKYPAEFDKQTCLHIMIACARAIWDIVWVAVVQWAGSRIASRSTHYVIPLIWGTHLRTSGTNMTEAYIKITHRLRRLATHEFVQHNVFWEPWMPMRIVESYATSGYQNNIICKSWTRYSHWLIRGSIRIALPTHEKT